MEYKAGGNFGSRTLFCQSGAWRSNGKGLGYGQSNLNVLAYRVAGQDYVNDTGAPILVTVTFRSTKPTYQLIVDGVAVSSFRFYPSVTNSLYVQAPITTVVPPGSIYRATGGVVGWTELRNSHP